MASWKKAVGDKVVAGDILAEIQTDKARCGGVTAQPTRARALTPCQATMEMESMEEGYLARILVAAGTENIPVGKARSGEAAKRRDHRARSS